MLTIKNGSSEHRSPLEYLQEALSVFDKNAIIDPSAISIINLLKASTGSEYEFLDILFLEIADRLRYFRVTCKYQPKAIHPGYNISYEKFLKIKSSKKDSLKNSVEQFIHFCQLEISNPNRRGVDYFVDATFFSETNISLIIKNELFGTTSLHVLRQKAINYVSDNFVDLMFLKVNQPIFGFRKTGTEIWELKKWIRWSKESHLQYNKYFTKL